MTYIQVDFRIKKYCNAQEEMLLDNKIIINIRSNKNRESNEDFTALSCLLSVEIVE